MKGSVSIFSLRVSPPSRDIFMPLALNLRTAVHSCLIFFPPQGLLPQHCSLVVVHESLKTTLINPTVWPKLDTKQM